MSKRLLTFCLMLALAGCVSTDKPAAKSGWAKVVNGMTRRQVHKLVGAEPLPGSNETQDVWLEGSATAPWRFVVTYDKDGKVSDYRSVFERN